MIIRELGDDRIVMMMIIICFLLDKWIQIVFISFIYFFIVMIIFFLTPRLIGYPVRPVQLFNRV